MRNNLICVLIWLFAATSLQAQERADIRISLPAGEWSFSEWAGELEKQGIRVFFREAWVEGLRIRTRGGTESLDSLLQTGFAYQAAGFILLDQQVFITPKKNAVTSGEFSLLQAENGKRGSTGQAPLSLARKSYEKTVRHVVIGSSDPAPANQRVFLTGRITSAANGEPVIGATVALPDQQTGAVTDADGNFSIAVVSGQTATLQVACLGMESEQIQAEIKGPGFLPVELYPKLIDVREVVVRSDQHHNIRGMQMGFQKIGAREIKSIPVVMGERDIFKVATLMPGVQTVGEGAAGFNVRGSASDQNLFLLNDIPVLNTGHLFGFFSAFNPDMIADFRLYKSNFPVEYGGRLASVFDISTRTGNKKEFGARGSVSPVTASLLLETPIKKDRSSFIFSSRSTYSDWILDRLDDAAITGREAGFYDLMSGLHFIGKNNSSTRIFGYYSRDRFTLSATNQYRYENLGASVHYNRPIRGSWNLKLSGVFSSYTNYHSSAVELTRGYQHEFTVGSEGLRAGLTGYPWAGHKLQLGVEGTLHHIDQGVLEPFGEKSLLLPVAFGRESALEYALHAADEISLTDQLTLYAGLRYSLYNYLGPQHIPVYQENLPLTEENMTDTLHYEPWETISQYSGPEFRTALNYVISPGFSIKASYNRMRQYLFMLSNTIAISPTDRWKLVDPFIRPPVSDQISLGLYKNFNNSSVETSAEFYYKKARDIIEYKDGVDLTFNPHIETLVLQGGQEAYGAEFFIRRNTGRLTGWISYAWSRSIIRIDGGETWQQINLGLPFPANYDKPHALNVVTNYALSRRLSLSGNLVYNSGRPITYPTGYLVINDYPVVNYSLRNEYRIPDYFRVDLSLNVEGNLKKRKFAHGSWSFSVYNLTGRRNAYSVYFTNDRGVIKGYQLSIYGEAIFTVSYQFKLGNYAVE